MKRLALVFSLFGLVACTETVTNSSGSGTTGTTSTTGAGGAGGAGGSGGASAGGAGGGASTGGAGGATLTPVECTDCLATTLAWEWEGGMSPGGSTATLSPCRAFDYSQDPRPSDPPGTPPTTCTVDLGACDVATGGVRDVEQALAHPDVVKALAKPDALYGDDQTCVDRPILRLTVGGVLLRIGYDCMEDGSSGCTAKPCNPKTAGMAALEKVVLDTQVAQLKLGDCAAKFP